MQYTSANKVLVFFFKILAVTCALILFYFILLTTFALSQSSIEYNSLRNKQNLSFEFLSIKSFEAFMRKGPGKQFPKLWLYKAKGAPVKVILRLTNWIKISDWKGRTGWIHRQLLSPKPSAIIIKQIIPVMTTARPDSNLKGYIKFMTLVFINKCIVNWCEIQHTGISGWVQKNGIWGNLK